MSVARNAFRPLAPPPRVLGRAYNILHSLSTTATITKASTCPGQVSPPGEPRPAGFSATGRWSIWAMEGRQMRRPHRHGESGGVGATRIDRGAPLGQKASVQKPSTPL